MNSNIYTEGMEGCGGYYLSPDYGLGDRGASGPSPGLEGVGFLPFIFARNIRAVLLT